MRRGLGSTGPLLSGLLLSGLLLGGCSDAEPRAGAGSPATSEATTPGGATSEPAPPEPSQTRTVSAARGPRLELDHVTVRAPRSYRTDGESATGTFLSAAEGGLGGYLGVHETPAIDADLTLRQRAKVSARNRRFTTDRPPRLAGFVTVDGVRMYHLTGPADENDYYDEFGAVVDGLHIYTTFTQPREYPRTRRERVIESVLASLTWR